jgi:hypothetical protein
VVSAGFAAPVALGDSCDRRINPIFDGGGYIFDFGARPGHYGSPVDGGANGPGGEPPGPVSTNDSWDDGWGNVWVFSPGADLQEPAAGDRYLGPEEACSFALGGQEIAYPLVRMHGLEVQHRWYVDPGALHGARILTVLHNPGSAPVGAVVVQGNPRDNSFGLGSDSETTPRVSSDGTGVFSSSSFWGVTTDEEIPAGNPDPALAHVWDGQGGAMRASEVVLGDGTRLAHDVLYWDWKVTVPPGGTRAFISYEVQAAVRSRDRDAEIAQAVAQAKARERQSLTSLYIGMSPAEIAATMNWPRPIPTALIAPVASANAATPVRLSAGGSTGASEMPRCEIAGYAWIADGSPIGAGATLSRFFGPGEHRVTLTVSNDCGGSQSTKLGLEVAPGLKLGKLRLNRDWVFQPSGRAS